MVTLDASSAEAAAIDRALEAWRQGDAALDERWFVHVGDGARALTEAAAELEGVGPQAIDTEVSGLIVTTQTCDVVRACTERPYVEVSPLAVVNASELHAIARGRRPAYAHVPALHDRCLVADLDRTMTVEKSIIAGWRRTPGMSSDAEMRAFGNALARKRARFAFPDDFTAFASKLVKRLKEKHDKSTPEGRALTALREIRVTPTPAWGADAIELMFFFVRNEEAGAFEGKRWDEHLESWLSLLRPSGRFIGVDGIVVALAGLSAADYLGSDALDLDHLSQASIARAMT